MSHQKTSKNHFPEVGNLLMFCKKTPAEIKDEIFFFEEGEYVVLISRSYNLFSVHYDLLSPTHGFAVVTIPFGYSNTFNSSVIVVR
jgi:hypothetical protein